MKKINVILWSIVVFCGILTAIKQFDGNFVVLLKNTSIVFTVSLPYIYKKLSGKENALFTFVWIIFIFMAHYIGVILYGYNHLIFYDKVTHTLSGVVTAYLAIMILKYYNIKNIMFNILFIICFSWMCAGMWEVFEYVCNIFVGGDAQRVALTGVNDTMLDMIVAFIGSLVTSIIYYFCKKNKLYVK